MNETIQEILKKYGEYPSGEFPHIEWLKGRLLDLDEEIDQIQEDRNRLLSDLCKARNKINRLEADMDGLK
jgi:predicted  nucleic acid-binding Zn-ribbon protein